MADENTLILKSILAALQIPGEGSASQLILEVRNAIKSTSEPTLRDTILDLKNTMQHEFTVLRQVLRDEAGMGRGTIARPPGGDGGAGGSGEANAMKQRMQQLEQHLDEVLSKLERATIALESGGGHGGGPGGGDRVLRSFNQRDTILSITVAIDNITKGANAFQEFGTLLKQQQSSIWKDFGASIMQISLHTLNAASQLRNLHGVLRQEIQGISTSGVYGSNSLSSMEYLLEGPKRLIDGVLTETDSFRTALKSAHEAIQDHMMSPMVLTGKDLAELSHDFRQARQNMREAPGGFDNRGWMTFEETNKSLQDMVDFQHRMGIKSGLTDSITQQNTSQSLNFLKVIATMTGQTVGALEKQLNEQQKQAQILAGIGRLTPSEAKVHADLTTGLSRKYQDPAFKQLLDFSSRLQYFGRDRQQILGSEAPDEIKRMFSVESQFMQQMMQFNELGRRPLGRDETTESRMKQIELLIAQMGPALQRFQQMGFSNSPQQAGVYGGVRDTLGAAAIASNMVSTRGTESEALKKRQETDFGFAIGEQIREYFKNFVQPFLGLTASLGANTLALIANTGLLTRVSFLLAANGIGGGGLGGILGAASKVGRFALGASAGLGAAYSAHDVYQNVQQGNTGGVIGGLGGAGVGALAGGVIGSLTGWFSGPFGAIAGAAIGEQLGSWISKSMETHTPAIPVPTNMAGPDAAAVAAATNTSHQDSNLALLTQLVEATGSGNVTLGQIYGELSRQTGYLGGGSGGSSSRYTAQGLTSGSSPAVAAERRTSDASFPWVGGF